MSRWWWLALALVLSIGINVGLVASRVLEPSTVQPAPLAPPNALPRSQAAGGIPLWISRLAHALALESDRRERFVAIQQRFVAAVEDGSAARRRAQVELRRALLDAEPDRAEIDRLLGRLSEANGALERAFAENVLASRDMLGPAEERRFLAALRRLRLNAERRVRH